MPARKMVEPNGQHSLIFFGADNSASCDVDGTERPPGIGIEEQLGFTIPLSSPTSDPGYSDLLQFTREELFEELLRLRDDERDRIGHELHDSAGQLLLYLQLSVARLKMMEAAEDHQDLIEEIQSTARQIAAEIRSLAFLNHPVRMSSDGLSSALSSLIEGFGKRTGCKVSFTTSGQTMLASDAVSLAMLRVGQEALVNVHRHAHASSVTMKLTARDGCLELTICDNGVGLPSMKEIAVRGGVGLEGMRFRIEQLGGEFEITNAKRGTKIVAKLPLGLMAARQAQA